MKNDKLDQRRQRIIDCMEKQDISRRALSLAAGFSESRIKDFLSGKTSKIDYDDAKAIAKVLNTTVEWIMDGEGEEDSPQEAVVVDIWDSILDEGQRKAWVDMGRSLADKDSKSG